ncbi:cell division protein CrgA [Microbacterium indicum]|uniref:cell division protein CrgA n=1 Tax=Microbacterium indicum TaxID=358100 RepID=UPI00041ECEB7|nr:cell division protein CrgA [Microbacterium indicum]
MARKKTTEEDDDFARVPGEPMPNPAWFLPVMVAFFLVGLAWILVFYLSGALWPIPDIGAWNLAIGGGLALIGLIMATRWR